MGFPLGPLPANTLLCLIEAKLEEKHDLNSFNNRLGGGGRSTCRLSVKIFDLCRLSTISVNVFVASRQHVPRFVSRQ